MSDRRREKALEQSRKQLREKADPELHVRKALSQLDSLKRSFSEEAESFRDWYSIHFTELTERIEDDRELVEVLEGEVKREDIKRFEDLAEDSKGKHIRKKEIRALESSLKSLSTTLETIEQLEEFIRSSVRELAPNLSDLLGEMLAAKIISAEGDLESLAKQPASTIQTLGAETALFRHLRGEGSAPKHGVIFEHEFVSDLPEEERGKMARFLANKAAIAARLDYYGEKEKG
ncbi:MAG: hypothetical protein ABEJ03_02465, partial [Candidatus Nanohaloarchaea archaeon]